MSSVSHPGMLARYTAWANARLYESLARESNAVLSMDRPGRQGGILGVLGHIHVVSLIWKAHLTGRAHGFTTRRLADPVPLAELRERQSQVDDWYVAFAESRTTDGLAKDVRFLFVDGSAGAMTVEDMLLHVVNHSTYHRGYVADMLYDSGSAPPTMDLPVYVREVRARGHA